MTKDLNRVYEQEIDTVRRWLAAGEIKDYKARDDIGAIWVKLPNEGQLNPSEWVLYWDWREYLKPHHPTEADLF